MRSGKSCDFLASHNSKKLTLHCIIGFKNNFTKKALKIMQFPRLLFMKNFNLKSSNLLRTYTTFHQVFSIALLHKFYVINRTQCRDSFL